MNLSFFSGRRSVPIVMQNEITECGLASLSMCFQYHGIKASLKELRDKYPVGVSGMNMGQLSDVCENEGMVGDVYQLEVKEAAELPMPAILHWDLSHFVVLTKIKKGRYHIHDPSAGELELTEDKFSNHFSGYALTIERGQASEFELSKSGWDRKAKEDAKRLGFVDIFKRSHGLGKGLFYIIAITMVAQFVAMALPLVNQVVIDNFIGTGTQRYLLSIVAGGVGLVLFVFLMNMLKGWASIYVGFYWHANFSSYFFQRMVRLPVSFFETRNIADINMKFKVLDKLKQSLTEQLVSGFIDGMMSVVTILVMFSYQPKLALFSLLFLLIYVLIRSFLLRKEVSNTNALFSASVKESHTFFETLNNVLPIKMYAKEGARYQQWKMYYLKAAEVSVELAKVRLWFNSWQDLLEGIERFVLLYVGAIAVIAEQMTLGMLFAFFAYREVFSAQSKSLLDNYLTFKVLKVDLDRLSDIEVENVEENMMGDLSVKHPVEGEIELKNMTYTFPGAQLPLFNNISLKIAKGEHVVLVGRSGCGKSTLMRLLIGAIPIESGELLVDGYSINTIGHSHFRKYIAIVSQQEGLISGSVAENIAFFDPNTSQAKIDEAAKRAHIFDEIMLMPMQFETRINSSHSSSLSGGQTQRILIARAIYAKPTILFMDEATSALDAEMEKKITKTLSEMDITRVSIAHRKETRRIADREIDVSEL